MSITLEVSLISGRTVSVQTDRKATVDRVKQSAQSQLFVGRAKLVTASGRALEGATTIGECGLTSGDSVTLHVARKSWLPGGV